MDNTVVEKSKRFALRIIKAYKYLLEEYEFVMSKQLLKSGTSIGANISEAEYAQTPPDFIAKMSIALKEANETKYWIELLMESGYLTEQARGSLMNDCTEIIKLLTSIIKTKKDRLQYK